MYGTHGEIINKLEQEISENLDAIDYEKLSKEDRYDLVKMLTAMNMVTMALNLKTNQ